MKKTFMNVSLMIISILFWLELMDKSSAREEVVWILVKGTNEIPLCPPVYGDLGVPDPANHPGARSESVSWINKDGTLFLYGGWCCNGQYNDLWKYERNINQWS